MLLRKLLIGAIAAWSAAIISSATADVMVVSNRTPRRIPMQVTLPGAQPWQVTLGPEESRPLFADSGCEVLLNTGSETARYSLEPGEVYFIGERPDKTIDLQQIGLGQQGSFIAGLPGSAATTPAATIPVKILVDDDQITRRAVWEPLLRKRVEAASALLHRHAMVKLEVVAVDRWVTDDSNNNFHQTLAEFERAVDPFPGELALGFSSQYEVIRGRVHMGGTRGPLRPHILLREWSQHATENEKLELLLHELGHYLGAAHSPEPDSVMRPLLADRKSRRNDFIVKFDPVNTLIMSMVGEELRRRRVSRFAEVAPATKTRLREIYQVLGYAKPEDPAARTLTGQLGSQRSSNALSNSARSIIARMTQSARANQKLPLANSGQAGPFQVEGDHLFVELVRLAAQEANKLPQEHRTKAFLLAIGIAIGDPQQLNKLPAIASVLRPIETPAEQTIRSTYIGKPTIKKRHDLARHYAVAAMLVAISGRETAETLSMAKEVLDANGGTGFSFADLAADKAGIALAVQLLDGKKDLAELADKFSVEAYVPAVSELPEGMTTMQFIDQYGGQNDERFQAVIQQIDKAIAELPAFARPAGD